MNIKKYITTHGTSYYLASLFFPKNIKQEVFLLYAFVRVADDIVDNEHEGQKEKLQAFIARTQNIFSSSPDENTTERDQIIIPFAKLCKDKQIKQEWIESFLSAMKSDCEWKEYKTYTQLQEYMVGSAEVVGLMMCQIIGYPPHDQEKTFYHARKLGEAMQYTNFLRDIKEDRVERQRIYIPQDRLTPFGLDQNDIKKYCEGSEIIGDKWKQFMKNEIEFTKNMYEEADGGIALLNPQGRKAVQRASILYSSILDKIASVNYDVFTANVRSSKRENLLIIIKKNISALRLNCCLQGNLKN